MPKKEPRPRLAATGEPKGKKPPKGASSDVEQRWKQYWSCRAELEAACDAVRHTQEALARATEVEREKRQAFETTKNALKELLEVESPSSQLPAVQTRVN